VNDLKEIMAIVGVTFAIIAIISLPILIGFDMNHRHNERMAKIGYRQVMVEGRASPLWQPVTPCKEETK